MRSEIYEKIESYMLEAMRDSAHDKEHIYRVLYASLEIASGLNVNLDVLIAAALLHDIGRGVEANDKRGHSEIGAGMAYKFLMSIGFGKEYSERVRHCILTHGYRGENEPESLEARILFDADKLDAAGAIGIARTIVYCGIIGDPLYTTDAQGRINMDGAPHSFCTEYNYKLKNVYDKLYTAKARRMAGGRRKAASAFFEALQGEVDALRTEGKALLAQVLTDDAE